MSKFKDIARVYDELADYQNSVLMKRPLAWAFSVHSVLSDIGSGSVLDLACGIGREAALSAKYRNINYFGVDLSNHSLEHARKNHPGGTFIQMDVQKLEFENGFFDGFLCISLIQHLARHELPTMLKELNRVTRPGAIGFFATNEGEGDRIVAPRDFPDLAMPITLWTAQEFRNTLKRAGFEVERLVSSEPYLECYVRRN